MILKKQYEGIQDAMDYYRLQVVDSIPYCSKYLSGFGSPGNMFDNLKTLTSYANDPGGNEFLQTVQTLFENNIHGVPGSGDCDCFSILVTACCIVNNFETKVVLASKKRKFPTHIYNLVNDGGAWVSFDLTESAYGSERAYPILQLLSVNNFSLKKFAGL